MGGYLPCRVLVVDSRGVEEIWCALSGRAADGTHVRDRLRGILFAALESRFPDAVFEVRGDWPSSPHPPASIGYLHTRPGLPISADTQAEDMHHGRSAY